jgi:hypothetical protein
VATQSTRDSPSTEDLPFAGALALTVAGAFVGTVLGAFVEHAWGPTAGAMVGALVGAVFQPHKGKVRWGWVAFLSALAFFINFGLFFVADGIHGSSVLPGEHRERTYAPLPLPSFPGWPSGNSTASPGGGGAAPGGADDGPVSSPGGAGSSPGVAIAVSLSSVDCGAADVGAAADCPSVTVRSTGTEPLRFFRVRVEEGDTRDFTVANGCRGALAPGAECVVGLRFAPRAEGTRQAVVVVHQNLPSPDTGTRVTVSGVGRPGPQGPAQTVDLAGSWRMDYTPQDFDTPSPQAWAVTFAPEPDGACPDVTPCYRGTWRQLSTGNSAPPIIAWTTPDGTSVSFRGRLVEASGITQEYSGSAPDPERPRFTGTMRSDRGGGTVWTAAFTMYRP